MHRLSTSFVLGYHGCDRRTAEQLLSGSPFNISKNDYDWLGHGAYFWEANPLRALAFAGEVKARQGQSSGIRDPYAVGAVIDLATCLDLMSSTSIQAVAAAHDDFAAHCHSVNVPMPVNRGGSDLLLRDLDCAVINHLHEVRRRANAPNFDTVRGVFLEGDRIYPNAGFREKTHVQICVRNLSCIKGVFRVPDNQLAP